MALFSKYVWQVAVAGALGTVSLLGSRLYAQTADTQQWIDGIASNMQVHYQVLLNKGGGECSLPDLPPSPKAPCSIVELSLSSPDKLAANALDGNWSIYFSQTDPIYAHPAGEFTIDHINGDLHLIRPSASYQGFNEGEVKKVQFIVAGLTLTEAKIMPNYYVVAEGQDNKQALYSEARVIESTRIRIHPETGLEVRPFAGEISRQNFKLSQADKTPYADAAFIFNENKNVNKLGFVAQDEALRTIIPTPTFVMDSGKNIDISAGINLQLQGVEQDAVAPALARLQELGLKQNPAGMPFVVSVSRASLPSRSPVGAYQLVVSPTQITIFAREPVGAFYGMQSLASVMMAGRNTLPVLTVNDSPRYPYRGMHIDVGRNFHSKQQILDVLDQMAAYKLNKLHLHLGEDEGWRLQIPGLPELTDVGGKRCHDPQENTCLLMQLGADVSGKSERDGYYTRQDYIELVKAANARYIQLIPSFDMPGHSRAVIKAMEARYRKFMAAGNKKAAEQYLLSDLNDKTQYKSIQFYSDNTINACMESPYKFLGKVIDEVKAMHSEAGQPLTVYHIGADETAGAWAQSPICQAFFANNPYDVENAKQLGAYFIERVAALLETKGIKTAGWSDGLSHTNPKNMPAKVQSYIWDVLPWGGVAEANKQANRGWDVVLSHPDALYFDFPYEPDPKEGGYYWGSRHIDTHKVFNYMPGNLPALAEVYPSPTQTGFEIADTTPLKQGVQWAGIQGQLWSETIRSDNAVEYMIFPRLIALAERAWHAPSWEPPYNYEGATYNANSGLFSENKKRERDKAWLKFASVIGYKEFVKLDAADIHYRIPTVGAIIQDSMLHANLAYPALGIEYKEAGKDWQPYNKPVQVKTPVLVRAKAATGDRKGRALPVE
ncbi:family 20 glycosylhydrolase [Saccharophagus degradans]|uniref:beta-N-acetylhexosaminidase n=1 Tax=Saccharophagus degradans TaxID=86304 RepID=A0AAW7X0W9_9GAMM|nr:family 20 glycosylhydrolase [Saccharophagus degradans]MDO6421365.1 family 20 glycosylhydrolase [Saccharophagus degradans]MDO6609562.1 family 20 glycosylhydrolase [Saccharophagus degradans]